MNMFKEGDVFDRRLLLLRIGDLVL